VNGLGSLGRTLVLVGALVVLLGVALVVAERFPGLRIGRLPGDIRVERGSFRFYLPLGTSIALSLVLTLVLWIIARLR
jgi:Protein of unknown function (DUF2905)